MVFRIQDLDTRCAHCYWSAIVVGPLSRQFILGNMYMYECMYTGRHTYVHVLTSYSGPPPQEFILAFSHSICPSLTRRNAAPIIYEIFIHLILEYKESSLRIAITFISVKSQYLLVVLLYLA